MILDIGCGSKLRGDFGVDWNRHTLTDKGRVAVMDAEKLGFKENSFDHVVMYGVLEYIPRRERAMSEIRRVLKPKGTLTLTTPNACSLRRRIKTLLGMRNDQYLVSKLFVGAELKEFLQDNGFEILSFKGNFLSGGFKVVCR